MRKYGVCDDCKDVELTILSRWLDGKYLCDSCLEDAWDADESATANYLD